MRKHPFIAVSASTAVSLSVLGAFGVGSLDTTPVSSRSPIHKATTGEVLVGSLRPWAHRTADRLHGTQHKSRRSGHFFRMYFDGAKGIVDWRIVFHPPVTHRPKPVAPVVHVVYTAPVVPPPVVPPPFNPNNGKGKKGKGTYQPAGGVWYQLRMCESSNDYAINTGNGYYGAYQFAESTWLGLGFTGLPSNASPETQDEAAAMLQARSGWGQWPACSAMLGL